MVTIRSSAGAGATIIDVQGAGRAVTVDSCEGPWAVLQGLTITGGSTAGDGAGILAAGSSPTIIDCVITGNVAAGNGGGLRVTGGGSPAITGTAFSVNTAAAGGGLSAAAGTGVTVTDSAFCANVPDEIDGLVTLNGLVYLSDEPGCAPLVALGGCCLTGACVTTRQADCLAAGGTYLGDDAPCGAGSCPEPCPWDINGGGAVDTQDFLALLGSWGPCP